MHQELDLRSDYLPTNKIRTIYFGGGTPSLLGVDVIEGFIEHIRRLFDCSEVGEITLEANPDDLKMEYLNDLAKSSINRLSIGIQSFDERELRFMNRRHTADEAVECIENAKSAGFDNISIDLIFGVEGFGGRTLEKSVEQALALKVPHISLYHLTIEPGTGFFRRAERGEIHPVEEHVSEEEYALIREKLNEAGYEHYEISNFALKGYQAQHNSSYWEGEPYLGVGPAAHSYNLTSRRWSTDNVESYVSQEEFSFEEEQLSDIEQRNEMVMTSLRRARGLDLKRFERSFGTTSLERLMQEAKPLIERGALKQVGEFLVIPPEKFLISDSIIETLFEE